MRISDWSSDVCSSDLLRSYLASRHPDGGMADMDEQDFADMVEQTPVDSYMIEYREPAADGGKGRLVGCCLTDRQGDGLSIIYRSEEHTSELQSLMRISYAVFCLKKKNSRETKINKYSI